MKSIGTCLWFDGQAEEAARYYVSLFPNARMGDVVRQDGKVLTASFTLNGHDFFGLNGGPMFKFTEAVSMVVYCDTQEEIDRYWAELSGHGGQEVECGWLKDKYGLCWQIVPSNVHELMTGKNVDKVMQVVMASKKLDKAAMERAARG